MNYTVKAAIIAVAALCPVTAANSESVPFEVTIEYDGDLLATEAGAATVLASIKQQARKACKVSMPIAGGPTIDRKCVRDLVEKTVAKIQEAQIEQGREMARAFASLESPLNGAPEQR